MQGFSRHQSPEVSTSPLLVCGESCGFQLVSIEPHRGNDISCAVLRVSRNCSRGLVLSPATEGPEKFALTRKGL